MEIGSQWIDVAVEAALTGGKVLNEYFRKVDPASIEQKRMGDWVSAADHASEDAILKLLRRRASGHKILTEESGSFGSDGASEFCWIIDPLDGTTNFLRGFPVWAVSIALEHKLDPDRKWGDIVAGAIFIPSAEELFTAVSGEGAFRNQQKISVQINRKFSESLLATGFPFRTRELADQYIDLFREVLPRCADVRRAGAVAVDLCYTAAGTFDGFWELDLAPWDIAAGALIIKEAGGKVSNFQGGEDFLTSGDIIAGSPLIYSQLAEIVRRHFPTPRDVDKSRFC